MKTVDEPGVEKVMKLPVETVDEPGIEKVMKLPVETVDEQWVEGHEATCRASL